MQPWRTLFVVALLLQSASAAPKRPRLARIAKVAGSVAISATEKAMQLLRKFAELLHISRPQFVYHMDELAEKHELIKVLWSGEYSAAIGRFSSSNHNLVSLFEHQAMDSREYPRFHELTGQMPRFEHVLSSLFRSRSQKLVPLEVAALSIRFLHYQVPRPVWTAITFFTPAVMSRTWTEELVDLALDVQHNPGCPYVVAEGMSGAAFDNFRHASNHGAYSTTDSTGSTLDMTNWATIFIPASAVPGGRIDIKTMLGAGGLFKTNVVLDEFLDLFSQYAPDMVANRHARWSSFLEDAAVGKLWQKERFRSPYPPTYFHYHPPFFDKGQSSYADVNFCLDRMRDSSFHKHSDCIQLGGDGLSYMRLIDRIAQDPQRFLCTTPVIMPRLGESPHGKYHVLHGHWRLWQPLLLKMAEVLNNKQVVPDPTVSQFNTHEHFVRIVTRAFAEYILEISATGMDYHNSHQFLNVAEKNLSFSYICYFLFLFGFHYAQFRAAVRRNDSHMLDRLWREFLGTARTGRANKTNYSKMTVILIYWGCCLVEPLQTVYHNTRTLRLLHTHVGWDMPIEVLNLWIKMAVVYNVTKDFLIKFISRLNFTHVVNRGLDFIIKRYQTNMDGIETPKNIDTDVRLIKEFLRKSIGSTWNEVTQPSTENLLELDLTHWGGDRNAAEKLAGTPWAQIRVAMTDVRTYVQRKVTNSCRWHRWL